MAATSNGSGAGLDRREGGAWRWWVAAAIALLPTLGGGGALLIEQREDIAALASGVKSREVKIVFLVEAVRELRERVRALEIDNARAQIIDDVLRRNRETSIVVETETGDTKP